MTLMTGITQEVMQRYCRIYLLLSVAVMKRKYMVLYIAM
jgi:hypothetical protein